MSNNQSTHCLNWRIPGRATLEREVRAWEQARNAAQVTIDWQFTTVSAGIKLKQLYSERKHKV